MCGIAGVWHQDGKPASETAVSAMVARLHHRGPDETGVRVDQSVALAHARLSIIDPAHGRQPMATADGQVALVFNGEIFNYVELRRQLQQYGHRFITTSDTEVVLRAYCQFGPQCVDHFNGQWALAVWDGRQRTLFLSRDRWGIRPLYYAWTGRTFRFASEIKAIFADPQVPRRFDAQGFRQLFTLWAPLPPRTVFESIQELPPGHNLLVTHDQTRCWSYWHPDFTEDDEARSAAEAAEQLHELLVDATRLRLRADVPVGAYLSGGLDSSIIASLACQLSRRPLHTFSVTFDDDEFDERAFQHQVARFLSVPHHSLDCAACDIARAFPGVVRHAERPMLRTAPAPLFLLSQFVHQQGMKVVLTGEGADEMLGGYDIFKEAKVRRFCARQPSSARRTALFARLYPYLPRLQAQPAELTRAFFRATPDDVKRLASSHRPRWDLTASTGRLFSEDFLPPFDVDDVVAEVRDRLPEPFTDWSPLGQAQYLEATILLPGYILASQGDRVSLAHSVEGRFPFLDHRLAEFAGRLPARWKLNGLREKHLLKRAMAIHVPPEITARSKQPYRAPDAASFFDGQTGRARAEYIDELISEKAIREAGVFEPSPVAHLIRKARNGRAVGARDNMAMVGVLSTQLLYDQFLAEPKARPALSAATDPHSGAPTPAAARAAVSTMGDDL